MEVFMSDLSPAERAAMWVLWYQSVPYLTYDMEVLQLLRSSAWLTTSEVARELGISGAVASKCIQRLLKRELISRAPGDHATRYRYYVEVYAGAA